MSYLTSLDKYSLSTMFIITIELLYHAIMGAIFPHMSKMYISEKAAYLIDFGAFCFFFSLILLQQILFAIFVLKVNRFRKQVHNGEFDKLNEDIILSSSFNSKKKKVKSKDSCKESEIIPLANYQPPYKV